VGLGAGSLDYVLESISLDLQFLSNHGALKTAINDPTVENISYLTTDFVNFSASKGFYNQIRWLDETGMEKGRVDFNQGKAQVVAYDNLQNKAKRYYFTDAFRLKPWILINGERKS